MKKIVNDDRRNWIFLALIITFGFCIRFFIITQRDIFTDEIFYLQTAINSSIKDIFLINHWIKDHGILYFLFLKGIYFFSHNIVHLRISNLFLYVISSILIFLIFKRLRFNRLALIPVLLFAIKRYFVYLSSLLLPYNLAFTLSILSIYSLISIIMLEKQKQRDWNILLFIVSTSLSFYSDYTFSYLCFFYLLIYLNIVFFQKAAWKKAIITKMYFIVLLLIIPGLVQVYFNFPEIRMLNILQQQTPPPILLFESLAQMLFIRAGLKASLLFIGIFFIALFSLRRDTHKYKPAFQMFQVTISSFLTSSIFIIVLTKTISLSAFMERSLWVLYLLSSFFISFIVVHLFSSGRKKIGCVFFVVVLAISYLNYVYPHSKEYYVMSGIANGEIRYADLLQSLNGRKLTKKTDLIFISDSTSYYPLEYYYLSSAYPAKAQYGDTIKSIKKKYNSIRFIKSSKLFTVSMQVALQEQAKLFATNNDKIFVFFELDKQKVMDAPYVKNINQNNIYFLMGKDDNQLTFHTLNEPQAVVKPKPNELPAFNSSYSMHPYLGYVLNYGTDKTSNKFGFVGESIESQNTDTDFTIGIFGGSVADYYYQYQKDSFKRELEKLHLTDKKIKIYSFALGGYKEPQQLMTLQYLLSLGYKFDLIINIDGFNETALSYTDNYKQGTSSYYPRFWNLYSRQYFNTDTLSLINEINNLEAKKTFFMKIPSFFRYIPNKIVDILSNRAQLALEKQLTTLDKTYQSKGPESYAFKSESEVKQNIIHVWENSTVQLEKLAEINNIRYFEFLQPNQYLSDSKPFSTEEKSLFINKASPYSAPAGDLYPKLIERAGQLKAEGMPIFNLTNLFKNEYETLYTDDCCHYNNNGYLLITNAMVQVIQQEWAKEQ